MKKIGCALAITIAVVGLVFAAYVAGRFHAGEAWRQRTGLNGFISCDADYNDSWATRNLLIDGHFVRGDQLRSLDRMCGWPEPSLSPDDLHGGSASNDVYLIARCYLRCHPVSDRIGGRLWALRAELSAPESHAGVRVDLLGGGVIQTTNDVCYSITKVGINHRFGTVTGDEILKATPKFRMVILGVK